MNKPRLSEDALKQLCHYQTDVNLLVLGRSNRQGGFKTWALGTVPMYAVQHGNCPVLVVNPAGGPQTEYHATSSAEAAQGAAAATETATAAGAAVGAAAAAAADAAAKAVKA